MEEKLRYTFKMEEGEICHENNCARPAVKDYNGCGHFVCEQCYQSLSDYFDENYR